MGRLVALGLATIVALGVVTLGLQKSSARHPATVAQQTYRTNNGQRATVTLADGSVVSMAPETRITFSEINGNRQVMMQGHAYFHVASNQAEPFTVVAEGTVTRVLGTEFDVYAYPGVVPQVAVHSGKVAVAWKGTLLHEPSTHIVSTRNILTAGQAAVFRGPRDIERRTARDADFSWVTGILVYQDAPASVVAQEVRRYYGIDIRFANPDIANRRVTITLHDQPTSELINTFALALNVHYTRDGRVVTFR
jgi:ferric-dicitrate binding protein FerR (iron transport regulator)